MQRGQVHAEPARAELVVALRVLDRRQEQHLNPVIFLALGRIEAVEPVNKPAISRQPVSGRDHAGELAAISEHADEEVMLASFGTGQPIVTSLAEASESNPVPPG